MGPQAREPKPGSLQLIELQQVFIINYNEDLLKNNKLRPPRLKLSIIYNDIYLYE